MMRLKIYGSTIATNSVLMIMLLGFATHTVAAASVMDVLKPYYPLYNEALQCHGAIAPLVQ